MQINICSQICEGTGMNNAKFTGETPWNWWGTLGEDRCAMVNPGEKEA